MVQLEFPGLGEDDRYPAATYGVARIHASIAVQNRWMIPAEDADGNVPRERKDLPPRDGATTRNSFTM